VTVGQPRVNHRQNVSLYQPVVDDRQEGGNFDRRQREDLIRQEGARFISVNWMMEEPGMPVPCPQAFIYCRWHISLIQKGWEWILIYWLGLLVGPYSPHLLLGPSYPSLGLVIPASYFPILACSVI
jgi:hypothetical protein